MTFSRATVVACLLLGLLGISVAQVPAEQQAEMAINAARKAYNEGNLPAAREQFKQFLLKFGGAPQATSARYGLALSFMNAPEQDFAAAFQPSRDAHRPVLTAWGRSDLGPHRIAHATFAARK